MSFRRIRAWPVPVVILSVAPLLALTGCSGAGSAEGAGEPRTLQVSANFYPVQFLAERVGGRNASVTGLTPPGTEPHDLALSGPALQQLRSSDVVLYLGASFQPDIEKAVTELPKDALAVDLLGVPGLDLLNPPAGDPGAHEGATAAKDPHVWLDPVRMKLLARATADAMAAADRPGAAAYEANLKELLAELDALDSDLRQQLGHCTRNTLLTSHAAFGYLATRYGLEQIAIAGISPDDEPDAKTLANISEAASSAGVEAVFFEEQLNPALAKTVAGSIGAETRTLSPVEFDPGGGQDYFTLMRENAAQIGKGLGCQ